jgi:hypothetical protein
MIAETDDPEWQHDELDCVKNQLSNLQAQLDDALEALENILEVKTIDTGCNPIERIRDKLRQMAPDLSLEVATILAKHAKPKPNPAADMANGVLDKFNKLNSEMAAPAEGGGDE